MSKDFIEWLIGLFLSCIAGVVYHCGHLNGTDFYTIFDFDFSNHAYTSKRLSQKGRRSNKMIIIILSFLIFARLMIYMENGL